MKTNIKMIFCLMICLLCTLISCNNTSSPKELKQFQDIVFNDAQFNYDGSIHSIFCENVPEGADVIYEGNEQKEIGEYHVKATIVKEGYQTIILHAMMEILVNKNDFTGLVFSDQTFDYDESYHSLTLENVPDGADIKYSNNNQKEPGVYDVSVSISAEGYNTLIMHASLTIVDKRKNFENLIFNDMKINYDGKYYELEVQNLPPFACVTYYNNNKKEVGTYDVTATVSAPGYKTMVLKASLEIYLKQFSGIVFNNQEINYDGQWHSIYCENIPDFAEVMYSGNDQYSVGKYVVTATIWADGYETLKLKATMSIVKKLPKVDLSDRTLFYDGTNQFISYDIPDNIPRYTEVTFIVDGKTIFDETMFRVQSIGAHQVSIKLSCDGYEPSVTTASINVIEQDIASIDPNITPFKISNDVLYEDLRKAIKKGNFSVHFQYYDDYFYDGSTIPVRKADLYENYYVCNSEAFVIYDSGPKAGAIPGFAETEWSHYKIVGDELLVNKYEAGLLNDYYCYKYPASAFDEIVIGAYGTLAMAYLSKDENGNFAPGQEGGYTTKYGSFTIDETNNTFTLETRNHYFHPEFNHDEVCVYTIYNIGNTTINVPEMFQVENNDYNIFSTTGYTHNGFDYSFEEMYASCNVSMSARDVAFMEPGEYIVPAIIDNKIVNKYDIGYYDKYYGQDLTGYIFKVYIDEDGNYQGEYSQYGRVKNYNYLNYYLAPLGAKIFYYNDWHK